MYDICAKHNNFCDWAIPGYGNKEHGCQPMVSSDRNQRCVLVSECVKIVQKKICWMKDTNRMERCFEIHFVLII